MQNELSVNKMAHGRHHVAVDISSEDYEALTDGVGRPIPFQLNVSEGVALSVKLADDTAYADMFFNAGDNPALVIAVEADGAVTTDLVAVYPYKPAVTTL